MASLSVGTTRGFVRVVLFTGTLEHGIVWQFQHLAEWWIDPNSGSVMRAEFQYR